MNSHIKTIDVFGVVKSMSYGKFTVLLTEDLNRQPLKNSKIITARLSGKIRNNRIKITLGDRVKVQISKDNLRDGDGVIIFREK